LDSWRLLNKFDKRTDVRIKALILALGNAYLDGFRKTIITNGLDERDLAFEAGLIDPSEMELSVYATQKRGMVLQLLSEIAERRWITMYEKPPVGAYRVFISEEGIKKFNELNSPWWKFFS
jgi:hypothetical protein